MYKTIVFANQKGGVGKTTSAVNVGAYIAERGKKVLLIDFDPQGNLSSNLGADTEQAGIYELITGKISAPEVIQETPVENLQVISSNIHLTGATVELVAEQNREFFLKNALAEIGESYDYILIDCPPSLGLLTLNGLVAAQFVLIPLQCEYFALEGLSLLLKTIQKVQIDLNPTLKIGGILFTMYDKRTNLAQEVVQEVTSYFKDKVFRTIIPRNVKISEAPSHSKPINIYDPHCIGAISYKKLADEVIANV
ncbi:MAG: ParA family protein [Spirochaetales bacterium]|nr:ParA family protein [Spirochaetales bacterium]